MTGRTPRRRLRAAAALLAVAAASGVATSTAAAAASASCDGGVGGRTPIVLVHGFNSDAGTWHPDTRATLAAPAVRFCTTAFNYGPVSTNWVTDPAIGSELSARILALANASRRGGGSGRVVVVAHSMGGLAIRCAASTACGGSDATGQVLAAVVTFGTPNHGSFLKGYGASNPENVLADTLSAACHIADPFDVNTVLKGLCGQIRALGTSAAAAAFTPGSAQLRELPDLPADVPVLAVAGSLKLGTSFWGRPPKILGDVGDLLVNQESALAAARTVRGLGGPSVRDCGVFDLTVLVRQYGVTCTHLSETNNPDWLIVVQQLIRTLDRTNDPLAALISAGRRECLAQRPSGDSDGCTHDPVARISTLDPRYGFSTPTADGYAGTVFRRASATSQAWTPQFRLGGEAPWCTYIQGIQARILRDLRICVEANPEDPRELLEVFGPSWVNGDTAELRRYAAEEDIRSFAKPVRRGQGPWHVEVKWSDLHCQLGSSAAGGCDLEVWTDARGAEAITYDNFGVYYREVDRTGRLTIYEVSTPARQQAITDSARTRASWG